MLVAVFHCFTSFTTISPSCEICGTCKAWIWSVAQRYEINSTVNSSQRRDTCRPKRSLSLKTKHYTPISDKTPKQCACELRVPDIWDEDEWLRICLSTPRAVVLTDEAYKINFTLPVILIICRPVDAESPDVFFLIVEPWLAQRRKTGL